MKKGIYLILFLACLAMAGLGNTADLKGEYGEEYAKNKIETMVVEVINLQQLGFNGSGVYAVNGISLEDGSQTPYYRVTDGSRDYTVPSASTAIRETDGAPQLVLYRDYYLYNGELHVVGEGKDGYVQTEAWGPVRIELYLNKRS